MYSDHKRVAGKWMLGIVFVIGFLPSYACGLFKEVKHWYPADEVKGTWQTEVAVLEPVVDNRTTAYKSDCDSQDDCFVQEETCVPVTVDEYVFYKTIHEQVQGGLWDPRDSASNSFIDEDDGFRFIGRKYVEVDACQKTNQPAEGGYNFLDCPMWLEGTIEELVQRQDLSCTVELVTYRYLQTYPLSGEGAQIEWADPPVPPRGKKETSFKGQVTVISHKDNLQFEPDEYSDTALYLKHFNEKQYIGVGPDGVPVIAGSKEQWEIIYDNMGK